ncbi:hypothetical protein TNCT_192811 [Trichonephila clavata]|uniref:Uncharacterized protein n=1 Tax=Trichonephila clavata TaxID=2740835 RepID=A0A8X6L5L3_TRICU|nr:hypothetical protein TNCT_192811 [Trichonephila clavata]
MCTHIFDPVRKFTDCIWIKLAKLRYLKHMAESDWASLLNECADDVRLNSRSNNSACSPDTCFTESSKSSSRNKQKPIIRNAANSKNFS